MVEIKNILAIVLFCIISITGHTTLRLPALISDGMVLQRDAAVKIWGWAEKNEKIHVQFLNKVYNTTSNRKGMWEIQLENLSPGGPYKMVIMGRTIIIVEDILVGDIWVSSGQSNMNYKLSGAKSIYENEIAQSINSNIRYFDVSEVSNFHDPQKDIKSGQWISTNPQSVLTFSAVSYFFASELFKTNKVPIGIIHSSVSGTPAQAWISNEAIKQFPHYYDEAIKHQDDKYIQNIKTEEANARIAWYNLASESDKGYKSANSWFHPETNTDDWDKTNIPGYWPQEANELSNGIIWLRKDVDVPAQITKLATTLKLGRIINSDSVYINGTFVGNTGHQWARRSYNIPPGVLKEGKNQIVIRIVNHNGRGGFVPGYYYGIESDDEKVDLSGEWQYRYGVNMEPLLKATVFSRKATGLFNGMIAPLTNYTIKGVIWYQGESNAGKAIEYASLLPVLIKDWREQWDQVDFPFLFVQLANFMAPSEQPAPSNWAMLREAQRQTLSLPNTGMAVAIDIGEANDVHPMNKKDVGYRLALEAQRVAYGRDDIVTSGPTYESMVIDGNKIILSFETFGSAIKIGKNDNLHHFAIAGRDKKFVWAQAEIIDNRIMVWHDDISDPIAVRYAWADNPISANLTNTEGLPASPFRTDNWEN